MKISHLFIGTALLAVFGLGSCTTDFELNAPYEAVPVVYGFVEPLSDTQYVKINKSFLGDGNNNSYAPINDSTEFTSVGGNIDVVRSGTVVSTFPLQEKYVSNLDDGIFYTDSQKVYFWVPDTIYEDATYKLDIDINEGQKEVTAETEVVGFCAFKQTFKNKMFAGAAFANTTAPGQNVYTDLGIEWSVGNNGKRYRIVMVFNYEEHRVNADIFNRSIQTSLGTQVAENNTSDFFYSYNGESFFAFVESRLKNDPEEALIEKRVPIGLEFHIVMADENLHTYMEVNEPASGIVSERPVYTNINGGIGLFASRNTTIFSEINTNNDPIQLSTNTKRELVYGPYTSAYKFCIPNASDQLITCP